MTLSMQNKELEHLIKMVNDIASNLAYGEDAAASAGQVVAHLKRFWAPSMRELIIAYEQQSGEGLSALSRQSIQRLAQASDS